MTSNGPFYIEWTKKDGRRRTRMTSSAKGRVAVIGLGSMGLGMAGSLVRGGFDVAGSDIRPEPLAALAAAGGRAAASPAEAARDASVVVTVVLNAAQTEEVLFGAGAAAAAMAREGVIVSSATMSPDDARRLAQKAAAQKLFYLDAPISGGAQRAAEGALTIMAAGAPAAFAKARPVLDAMAETLYELGAEPGTGAAFKIVNQLLAGVHIAAASEALALAARMGLDLARVHEVITKSAGNSWMFENRGRHIVAGDYAARSAVDIFVKDLGIVEDIARGSRFPAPLASAALQLFLMTSAAGMGRDDDASVARLYARIAGLRLPGADGGAS
jgi:3-hydroxyisobutyrate dehydrogenase